MSVPSLGVLHKKAKSRSTHGQLSSIAFRPSEVTTGGSVHDPKAGKDDSDESIFDTSPKKTDL
jgi:hypothetical protein